MEESEFAFCDSVSDDCPVFEESTEDCVATDCSQTSPTVDSFLELEPICATEQSSFCVELMKRLNIQREQNYLCDITLVAKEGKEFKAHRIVLLAASPFFVKLLQSEMKEKEEGVIRFEEISESILADVIHFIYTGSIKVDAGNAKELITAADYLLLKSLKIISGRFLQKQISSFNCISTFYFAEKYRCEELVLRSTKFIHDNFVSVSKSDEFFNLEAEEVEKWISSENVLVAAEEDVFKIILNWIEQNKRERKDKFEQLFRHVRLVSLSRDCLLDVVTNELVVGNVSCSRQVVDAIKLVITASEDTLMHSAGRRIETHVIAIRGGKNTYCYLPDKDEWKRMAEGISEDRNLMTQIIKFRDQLYSFPSNTDGQTERYDPAFNSWVSLKLSLPHVKPSMVVLNGQIHAIYRPYRSNPVIQRYDAEFGAWQTVSSSQDFHYSDNSCVVACGNCLYVLGSGQYANRTKAGRYDTVTSKWEEIASMQIAKRHAFGVASQGKIFIAGCEVRSRSNTACEVYSVASDEWHVIASLNTCRVSGSMVCLNGTLYVLGGVKCSLYHHHISFLHDPGAEGSSSQPEVAVESYDPKGNKWFRKTSIPVYKGSEQQPCSFQGCTLKLSKGFLDKLERIK